MKVLIDVMNESFATKADIKELDMKIESVAQRLDSKIESEVQRLDSKIEKVDSKIDLLEYKLVFKLGALMVVLGTFSTGILGAVIKFSH
jgi:hypothetical protein